MVASRMDGVIGLGSNLGDRRAQLGWAVRACSEIGTVVAVSALYETRPVGGPLQPDYLNAALRLQVDSGPVELWSRLVELERRAGRERSERWAPRRLDLDILWASGLCLKSDDLVIPHPRLTGRAFALLPLLDVAPDATDPGSGLPYARLAAHLDRSGVRMVEPGPGWAPGRVP